MDFFFLNFSCNLEMIVSHKTDCYFYSTKRRTRLAKENTDNCFGDPDLITYFQIIKEVRKAKKSWITGRGFLETTRL